MLLREALIHITNVNSVLSSNIQKLQDGCLYKLGKSISYFLYVVFSC